MASEESEVRSKIAPITAYEKELLLQLIEERKSDVENKKSDFNSCNRKKRAWDEIADLFNSDGNTVKRTMEQLKKIWDNKKSQARKQVTKQKTAIRKTGGGRRDPELPPDIERIAQIIPSQLKSLENPFDCDSSEAPENTIDLSKEDEFVVIASEEIGETTPRLNFPHKNPSSGKKEDLKTVLLSFEEQQHELKMQNLKIQQEILLVELSNRKREREIIEEEHSYKKLNRGSTENQDRTASYEKDYDSIQGESASKVSATFYSHEEEVTQLLNQGNSLDALKNCLKNVPSASESHALKEHAVSIMMKVLLSVKPYQIDRMVHSLDLDQVGVLMKYIYQGFKTVSDESTSQLLTWHEKAIELGGVHSILAGVTAN